ncbi:MAG: Ig-like domain-containing protein, partial [SAR324 cluster bacterium]|nr:Ig-like domain-containing protein [SAR324 cluster bacterium]
MKNAKILVFSLITMLTLVSYSCKPAENRSVDDWATATFSLKPASRNSVGPSFSQSSISTVLISVVPADFILGDNKSIPAEYFDRRLLNISDYTVTVGVPLGRPLRLVQNVFNLDHSLDSFDTNVPNSSAFGVSDPFEIYSTADVFTVQIDLIHGPIIASISPADGSTDVTTDTGIAISFSNEIDPTTVSVNTTDTTCTGSIQLSEDEFNSCVQMLSAPEAGPNHQTYTMEPASFLERTTKYKIKVNRAITDAAGNCVANDFTTRFSTETFPKAITAFHFATDKNTDLAADVSADINGTTITATVPYGTDVTTLVATFTSTGESVAIGGTTQISGSTANDFTNSVTYTVMGADGTSQTFNVAISIAKSHFKAITTFSFDAALNTDLSTDVEGVISSSSITLMVPYATDITALIATFTTTGQTVMVGNTEQISGDTTNDYSGPVNYTVIAADDSSQDYE